ncbi:hypothetical protein [Paenibacillus xerothermodurans]|uniref:Uncharacterized protein n=1 Tax=Paenibacillus xerothermodurans TaxID=1977292 RepID=A0A2W1NDJ1_PAEXE|nr:hypothetical protein [Paenibacillus xerothermodurans]PZE22034.1 hypothetical protein CBW46_006460 [Paenibacillus xerothermodurans]
MVFDYVEFDSAGDKDITILVGCRFADEPEELYVVEVRALKNGLLNDWRLLFNGMDCKYDFKPDERAAVRDYLHSVVPTTEYAQWFEGSLTV